MTQSTYRYIPVQGAMWDSFKDKLKAGKNKVKKKYAAAKDAWQGGTSGKDQDESDTEDE